MAQAELRPDTLAARLGEPARRPGGAGGGARSAPREFGRRDAAQQLAQLAVELGLGSRAQERAA